jgi:hypothetical protein
LTGNRGVLKLFLKSEVRSHDVCVTADARPNGHISIGLRVLQHGGKRGFHFLNLKPSAEGTPFRRVCQTDLRDGKSLSDSRAMLDWFRA